MCRRLFLHLITLRHTTICRIVPSQRPLSVQNTTLTTDIQVPSGIRTRNPSKRTAKGPHIRPRDYWARLWQVYEGAFPKANGCNWVWNLVNTLNSMVTPDSAASASSFQTVLWGRVEMFQGFRREMGRSSIHLVRNCR